jgi:F-type H+-transporting ATPase subunit b
VRRLLRATLLAGALAAASLASAHAAEPATAAEHAGGEHEQHGVDFKTLGLQVLNFGVLLFILLKFGGSAVNKTLATRHQQLKTDLDEANRLRQQAEDRFRRHEERLANLEREIEAMLKSISQEAEQEKARIIAGAEEKARRIQDETRFTLDQQVKEAELRFRGEVAQAAVKIADELLRRSVTPGDEQRLAQSFVNELATRGDNPKGPQRGQTHEEEVVG